MADIPLWLATGILPLFLNLIIICGGIVATSYLLFRQLYLLFHNLTGLQLLKARSPNVAAPVTPAAAAAAAAAAVDTNTANNNGNDNNSNNNKNANNSNNNSNGNNDSVSATNSNSEVSWSTYVTQPLHVRAKLQQRVASVIGGNGITDVSIADEVSQASSLTAAGRNPWDTGHWYINMMMMLHYWQSYCHDHHSHIIMGYNNNGTNSSDNIGMVTPSLPVMVISCLSLLIPQRSATPLSSPISSASASSIV
jgi:hypothetical protein